MNVVKLNERLDSLKIPLADKALMYKDVEKVADELGLTLAEYGDGADYSEAEAYCYWNKSGNRNDPWGIYIEYDFDLENEEGRKVYAGTIRFKEINDEEIL